MKEVSLLVYELLNFTWQDLLAQAVFIIALVLLWAAGALSTDKLAAIAFSILSASGVIGAYKVYKLSKQSVRPRA
jgi:hypothetical protein